MNTRMFALVIYDSQLNVGVSVSTSYKKLSKKLESAFEENMSLVKEIADEKNVPEDSVATIHTRTSEEYGCMSEFTFFFEDNSTIGNEWVSGEIKEVKVED